MKNIKITQPQPDNQVIHGTSQLGALIRAARKDAGIPIDQAALLVGVSKQFLSDLENGKPTIQMSKAIGVANSFGIELVARRRGLSALTTPADSV